MSRVTRLSGRPVMGAATAQAQRAQSERKAVARTLAWARNDLGLTDRELAGAARASIRTVSRWALERSSATRRAVGTGAAGTERSTRHSLRPALARSTRRSSADTGRATP